MSLTARDVAEIVRVLEESSFDSLELDINGMQLRLKRSGAVAPQNEAAQTRAADRNAAAALMTAPAPAASPVVSGPAGTTPVPAPLLGIFYRAPKPGEPPFVQAGDRVRADSIIGIIEVMKLMNTVRAGFDGEIVQISAANGELVEYGQPLLWLRKS
ncbi:MAG TPA: biotin/lipoyl-containing protein [Steroidobacteraceae bacterium]|nr:biotin/lipoyl-containing protein [Steroidobacteraceae bacterium]